MPIKIGFDIKCGTRQSGNFDYPVPGNVQVETVAQGKHYAQVQRLSDSQYWDFAAGAWQAGAPTDSENLEIPGSDSDRGIHPARRMLEFKLPKELLDGVTAAGLKIWAYEDGGSPTDYIELSYIP